jgi:hypothetical protein
MIPTKKLVYYVMDWTISFLYTKQCVLTHTIRVKEESPFDFSIVLSLFKVLRISVLLNPRTPNLIVTCHNIKETKMKQRFAVQPNIH